MTDAIVLAYMAGVIDADGFVSCHRRKRGDLTYCAPLIGISGTSPEPHNLAKEIWGGSFFSYIPKNPTHRVQYQWQAVGVKAASAIRDILPFLLMKKLQALAALEIWEKIEAGTHRADPELLEMGARLSAMNVRNPPLKVMAI